MIISQEQSAIELAIQSGSVIVDAVAGSGKTHTCIYIGAMNPTKKVLILTYNAGLKMETRKKTANYANIEVHSYHSFINKYYQKCHNDDDIIAYFSAAKSSAKSPQYDFILVDEVQDMTEIYFKILSNIIKHNSANICVFGDVDQEINSYKGADSRYLTLFDKICGGEREFVRLSLSISFRITSEIASFISDNMRLKQIKTIKSNGILPQYLITNAYNPTKLYSDVFKQLLLKYQYSDIFILADTVGGDKSPIAQFANILTNNGINIFVANGCDRIEEDIIANKVCFSTFHQTKGLEREVVIIFGFDNGYFYNKEFNGRCPNELYVAATRAKSELILIHHETNEYLPFLAQPQNKTGTLRLSKKRKENCDVLGDPYVKHKSVTSFVKHIPATLMCEIMKYIKIEEIKKPRDIIHITNKVAQISASGRVLIEPVSDINGVAIPLYFIHHYELASKSSKKISPLIMEIADSEYKEIIAEPQAEYFLKMATSLCANGYLYRNRQITSYKWINIHTFELCRERLSALFANGAKLEFEKDVSFVPNEVQLTGKIDCYDHGENTIYEFKCVNALTPEHHLQLALYLLMFPCANAYLFNVLNDNLIRVSATDIDKIIHLINSYRKRSSDEEFIQRNRLY